MIRFAATILLITLWVGVLAQIPRDTSYTVRSTLLKQKKYYPGVSIPDLSVRSNQRIDKEVVYRTLNERALCADVYYPQDLIKKPGLVLIHGGGWKSGDPSLMKDLSIKIAEAGYVVMVPEYRMSLEVGYPAAVYDIKAAIRWFKAHAEKYGIDEYQVAIAGCSAGGQLAALVGVTGGKEVFYESKDLNDDSKVKAIIDIDGVLKFRHPDSSEGTVAAEWLGGYYEQVPKNWEEASALNYVDETTPPTLFLASKYPRFLAGHQEYMEVLESHGIYTKKVEMGDAPHSFWILNPWFEPTVIEVVKFLNETIK